MSITPTESSLRSWFEIAAMTAVIALLLLIGAITWGGFRQLHRTREHVRHTNLVLLTLEITESALIAERVNELQAAIMARRDGGIEAAQQAVNTDNGKHTMDRIRASIADMREVESGLLVGRVATAEQSYRAGLFTSTLSTLFAIVMVGGVFYLIGRNRRRAETTSKIVQHLDMAFARVWTLNANENMLELQASAGLYTHLDGPHSRVPVGKYKIGRIASNRRPHLSNSVPNDPEVSDQVWAKRMGMVAFAGYPLLVDGRVVGVMAMFASHALPHSVLNELAPISDSIAQFIDRRQLEVHREEAELQFRLLADPIPQLAWIADPGSDGHVSWFNQNWYDYTGTTLEQTNGTGWQSVHHAERVIQKFQDHVRRNADWEDTFPLRGKDGQYRWFLSRMKVFRDKMGKAMRIFGTNTDVTEQRDMADSLRRTAAELSDADRRKNEFLATLAHELRNPLAPIKNAVQLMGMMKLDEDSEDLRLTMARQVEQLVRLIDDLLDVSRISRGKIALRLEIVDIAAVVDAAVEASATFIAESGQRLSVSCPHDVIYVNVDTARITQVISNLLNNSAKYSDANCLIELTLERLDQQVGIRVRDNGIAIAADRLQDIFQMFSQVNDSLERGSVRLGIGLTLVKTLVELHGGAVTAESDGLEQGSTFTVRLPTAEKQELSESPIEKPATQSLRRLKILIVEDQRALRIVLTRLLEKMGHEVESVDGGIAAIAQLNDSVPELIFSDISMPGMTGYELVRQLRQRDDMRGTYVVAMTGLGQDSDRKLAIESGFDEHMIKPVDVDRLQDLFARLADRTADGEMMGEF